MSVPQQQHRIRRTSIRLELARTELMAPVQQALQDSFREEVLPELSALFDELVPTGQVLRIPKLEIDLGTLPPGAGADEWLDRCLLALRTAVQAQLHERIGEQGVEETFIASEQRSWEAWLFFLKTGRLPWWSPAPDRVKWEFELLTMLETSISSRALILQKQLRRDVRQIERLVQQFSPAFLQVLLRLLWPELAGIAEDVRKMTGTATDATSPVAAVRSLLQRVFTSALFQSPTLTFGQYSAARTQLAQIKLPGVEALLQAWDNLSQPFVDPRKESLPGTEKEEVGKVIPLDHPVDTDDVGWTIDNAGLAIIAPFFPPLFRALGLSETDSSLPFSNRQKAVALLRYLTDGSEQAPEYLLTLEKLLCGLPADWPAERDVVLSEAEKEEGGKMLTAVIQHWTALGNCSIPGLQETFLQRKGRLSRRPDGQWLLQPERKTVDILLDRLPWGYGVIQLPWMKEMVWVEW